MKGFVRILESVIASVVLLSAITFFFIPISSNSDWDSVVVQLQTQDSLASTIKNLDILNFIKTNNVNAIHDELSIFLPESVGFSVKIIGIPKPEINVGCLACSTIELKNLENLTNPINNNYKNRIVKFSSPKKVNFPDIDEKTDIIVSFSYANLNDSRFEIITYMENGGKVFLIDDLEENNFTNGFLETNFGLKWCDTCSPASATNSILFNTDEPKTSSFKVTNYYTNISDVSIHDDTAFSVINKISFSSVGVFNKIKIDNNTIMNTPDINTPFISKRVAMVKVYDRVNVRSAWMANNVIVENEFNMEKMRNLTKSVLMWLTTDGYTTDPAYIKIPPGTIDVYSYVGVLDRFEPFEIRLTVWKLIY